MEDEELIRRRMEDTRESLSHKLETLEDKLLGSVQHATSAVNETIEHVKDTVHEGVDSVKDVMDVRAHVDRHPWMAMGASVMCGYALGSILCDRHATTTPVVNAPAPPQRWEPQPSARAEPGLLAGFEPEINRLKGLAVGAALGAVRELVTGQVPPSLASGLRDVFDAITRKVGGEPVPSFKG